MLPNLMIRTGWIDRIHALEDRRFTVYIRVDPDEYAGVYCCQATIDSECMALLMKSLRGTRTYQNLVNRRVAYWTYSPQYASAYDLSDDVWMDE